MCLSYNCGSSIQYLLSNKLDLSWKPIYVVTIEGTAPLIKTPIKDINSWIIQVSRVNPFPAKVSYLNFHPNWNCA